MEGASGAGFQVYPGGAKAAHQRQYAGEMGQGGAKPNPQPSELVLLARKLPDTLERPEEFPAG
jgi:hypothetical protein